MNAIFKKRGVDGVVAQSALVLFLIVLLFLALFPVLVTFLLSVKPNSDFLTRNIWALPSSWKSACLSAAR